MNNRTPLSGARGLDFHVALTIFAMAAGTTAVLIAAHAKITATAHPPVLATIATALAAAVIATGAAELAARISDSRRQDR